MAENAKKRTTKREVAVISPERFSDIELLIRKMRNREGVIVDFEDVPPHIAQRMLDFLSGAVYALDGTVNKLKYKMYILIPHGVKINTVRNK